MKKMIRKIKLFDRAQTMVEFALVLPILAVLIFGLLEVGRMAFLYSTIATASREAVRYGSATGNIATGNTTKRYADCAGIRAAAQKVDFLDVISDANILITYDHGPGTTWSGALCPVGGTGPTSIKSGDRIRVIVSGDFNPIVGLVPLSARTITSSNFHTLLGSVTIVQPGFCPYDPTILDTDPACAVPTEPPAGTTEPPAGTTEPPATTEPPPATTEPPPTCGAITATTPLIAADLKGVTWSVTNASPVVINTVTTTWPAGSGNLTGLTIDTLSLGTFPAAPTSATFPSGGRSLTAGTHQFHFTYDAILFSGNFSSTVTFTTAGCSPVSGVAGVNIVTHPIPFPNVLPNQYTSPNWTLTNRTGTPLQISSIVVTWEGGVSGVCNSATNKTNLEQLTLGSQTWTTSATNQDSCVGYTIIPSTTWWVPLNSSNLTLTFKAKETTGITIKIYLVGNSYVVDSTNPLQKD